MIVLLCEGQTEEELCNVLLDKGHFIFSREDILDLRPLHVRQLASLSYLINTLPIDEVINVYRIGDTQKDDLDLSMFKARKDKIKTYKYCTKPEIEILLIINENLFDEYSKTKSRIRPKRFLQLRKFPSVKLYFATHDMRYAILEYKKLKKQKKDELYLSDIIKHEQL